MQNNDNENLGGDELVDPVNGQGLDNVAPAKTNNDQDVEGANSLQ